MQVRFTFTSDVPEDAISNAVLDGVSKGEMVENVTNILGLILGEFVNDDGITAEIV